MRENCSVITSWRSCSSVASAEMATIFGRGVMTSRTTLSPNSTTDWISLRSSSSINPSSVPAEISASMFSAEVGSSAAVLVSSVRSIRDWKKASRATQGRAIQANRRSIGTSGSSHWPPVRRESSWGSAKQTAIIVRTCVHGLPENRGVPGRAIGEPGEVENADDGEQRVFDQREGAGAILGCKADLVFQRVLEEFQRGEVAGAKAQAFQVKDLHESYQAKQREDGKQGDNHHQDHDRTRSIRPLGRPSLARQRFSARAMAPESLSWSWPHRWSTPCSMRIWISRSMVWPNSRACARARPREIAMSPRKGALPEKGLARGSACPTIAGNESTSVA